MAAHALRRYGGTLPPRHSTHHSLTPAQERRLKEMLAANLPGDITLAELAAECRLPPTGTVRTFIRATGLPGRSATRH